MNARVIPLARKRSITSEALFGAADSLLIEHAGGWYLLRKCAGGGLKLTRWTGSPPMSKSPVKPSIPALPPRKQPRVGLFGRLWLGD